MRKQMLGLACLCVFGLLAAGVARADSVYYLTKSLSGMSSAPTSTLCGGTSCFGVVDVSLSGGTATTTVTLTSGVDFVNTTSGGGDVHETFAFNLPSTFTLSNISTVSGWTLEATGQEAGYGTFSFNFDCGSNCTPPGTSTLDSLTFTVSGTGSVNPFLTLSGAGNSSFTGEGNTTFAADVIDKTSTGGGLTGVVADDGANPSVIPEPPSLLLLGTGLLFLAGTFKAKLLLA